MPASFFLFVRTYGDFFRFFFCFSRPLNRAKIVEFFHSRQAFASPVPRVEPPPLALFFGPRLLLPIVPIYPLSWFFFVSCLGSVLRFPVLQTFFFFPTFFLGLNFSLPQDPFFNYINAASPLLTVEFTPIAPYPPPPFF